MAQQQQQISVVSAGIAVSPPSLTQTSTTHQQPLPQVQHQQAAPAPAPAPVAVAAPLPAPAPAQPAPQPIAGGAAADPIMNDEFDDAVRNAPPNPWWLLFKLSFLVYIFSQNASTMRVVVLYVSALVIFLVQTRWLVGVVRWPIRRVRGGNGRQGGVVVPAPVPLPAADAANVRAAPGVGDQQLQQMDPNNDNATPQVTLAPQQPQPPSFLQNIQSLLWTFISTLIPENQQDN